MAEGGIREFAFVQNCSEPWLPRCQVEVPNKQAWLTFPKSIGQINQLSITRSCQAGAKRRKGMSCNYAKRLRLPIHRWEADIQRWIRVVGVDDLDVQPRIF